MAHLEKLKTLIPLETLEWSAQEQIYNALKLDFLKKLVIMPDCHTGYLLPIGGVALLDNVISPEYVGFDQGCGMCCVVTDMDANDLGDWNKKVKIFEKIYKKIPIGVGQCREFAIEYQQFKSASGDKDLNKQVNSKQYIQLGTLGAGNHFLEIGTNRQDKVVVTIHSGSRNPGHTIATYYINKSKNEDKDLPNGFFRLDSAMGINFQMDLSFALDYALENRKIMMWSVLALLNFKPNEISKYLDKMINENHNHAIVRKDGVLHRKGATPAEKDVLGVVPGTMKSGVYITKGLGNEEYLSSASHGAGRKFSRTQAKKSIELEKHKHWMKGIVAKVDKSTIDESHGAYKNLATVISSQEGIVIDVVDYIKPLINVKG